MTEKEARQKEEMRKILCIDSEMFSKRIENAINASKSISQSPMEYFKAIDELFGEIRKLLAENNIELCADNLLMAGELLAESSQFQQLELDNDADAKKIKCFVSTLLVPQDLIKNDPWFSDNFGRSQIAGERNYYFNAFLLGVRVRVNDGAIKILGECAADYLAVTEKSDEYNQCYSSYRRYCILNEKEELYKNEIKIGESISEFIADLYIYVRRWRISALHHSHREVLDVFKKAAEIFGNEENKNKTTIELALELLEFANDKAKNGSELQWYVNKFSQNIPRLNRSKSPLSSQQLNKRINSYKTSNIYVAMQNVSDYFESSHQIVGRDRFVDKVKAKTREKIAEINKKRQTKKRKLKFVDEQGNFKVHFKVGETAEDSMAQMSRHFEAAADKTSKNSATLSIRAWAEIERQIDRFFDRIFTLVEKRTKTKKQDKGRRTLIKIEEDKEFLLANSKGPSEKEKLRPVSVTKAL